VPAEYVDSKEPPSSNPAYNALDHSGDSELPRGLGAAGSAIDIDIELSSSTDKRLPINETVSSPQGSADHPRRLAAPRTFDAHKNNRLLRERLSPGDRNPKKEAKDKVGLEAITSS
jgi:hypothetical protein